MATKKLASFPVFHRFLTCNLEKLGLGTRVLKVVISFCRSASVETSVSFGMGCLIVIMITRLVDSSYHSCVSNLSLRILLLSINFIYIMIIMHPQLLLLFVLAMCLCSWVLIIQPYSLHRQQSLNISLQTVSVVMIS